ncbi:bile acid:sodium symporter [soil metagenome]
MLKKFLTVFEPFVLTLLGTVLLATFLPPRGSFVGIFNVAATAGIVLLFFLHGAKLSRQAIWDGMRNWKLHVTVLAVTFGLFPLLGLGLSHLPFVAAPVAAGLLFLTLLPSTVQSSIAFTAIARGNVAAAVCSASFSNLLGIVLTPALVALLMHLGGANGGGLAAVEKIVMQLLVPFVAGHLLRPLIGGFVARHKPLMTIVDRGSILLVVYTAFGAAVVEGLWHRVSGFDLSVILILCSVLLAIVLAATWALGRIFHWPRADAIVLLFCGSKKSLASGVPMAGVLFPAAQVGVILLPLMLFHQIQLIACAVIARRYAEQDPTPTRTPS